MEQTTVTPNMQAFSLHECEIAEAGYVQRREWVTYKIREDHYPFNTTMNFLIDSFDPVLFQKTINAMVERHEILRTTLRVIDGSLKQVIHPAKNFPVRFIYYDISQKEEGRKEDYIQNKTNASIQLPFNFELGPMFRVMVFKKNRDQYAIYFTFHHAIFDLHSFQVFREDISRIWKMYCNNFFQPLSAGATQYKECARFENELLNTEKGKIHERYWMNRLSGGIPRLQMIDDQRWCEHQKRYEQTVEEVRSRMKQLELQDESVIAGVLRKYRPTDGGFILYRYEENIFQQLNRYTALGKNGLLALFIASLSVAFHELSGQRFFAFDTPGSSRSNKQFKETIGWLTTGGPCFVSVPEDFKLHSYLDNIDKELYLLSRHCIYPFETVGSRYKLPLGGTMPIFFTVVNKDEEIPVQKNGIISSETHGSMSCQDIAFFFYVFKNAVSVSIGYDNLVFDASMIERLVRKHEQVFGNMLNEIVDQG